MFWQVNIYKVFFSSFDWFFQLNLSIDSFNWIKPYSPTHKKGNVSIHPIWKFRQSTSKFRYKNNKEVTNYVLYHSWHKPVYRHEGDNTWRSICGSKILRRSLRIVRFTIRRWWKQIFNLNHHVLSKTLNCSVDRTTLNRP